MRTYRIIYKSRAVDSIDSALIREIEQASARRNKALGITGVLLATGTQFLQLLEGEMIPLNQVYEDIVCDPRHEDVVLIAYQEISERHFDDWDMKGTGVGLLGRVIAERLKEKYGQEHGDLKIPLDSQQAYALLYDIAYYLKGGNLR